MRKKEINKKRITKSEESSYFKVAFDLFCFVQPNAISIQRARTKRPNSIPFSQCLKKRSRCTKKQATTKYKKRIALFSFFFNAPSSEVTEKSAIKRGD